MDSVLITAKTHPRVSILMPAFNAGDYIITAIESILSQSYQNIELIILDDCSDDSTYQIALSFNNPRIKVFRNDRNLGLAFSRNRLLKLVSTDFFAFQDADDISHPNRIQEQVTFLSCNHKLLAVGSQSNVIDGHNQFISECLIPHIITGAPDTKVAVLFENPFINTSMMVRASALLGMKYDLDYPPLEDYEFWSRLVSKGGIANLANQLVSYRIHDKQTSKQNIQDQKSKHIKIWHNYLNNIDVSLTEDLTSIHWEIAKGNYWDKYSSINPAIDYFDFIIKSNNIAGFFYKKSLLNYLANRISRLSDACPTDKMAKSGTGLDALSRMGKWGYSFPNISMAGFIYKTRAFFNKFLLN